jgi:rSAM/selenodomain-associated transferase 2
MLSVVIPTLNAESGLAACFDCLIPATMRGLVREVIVVDGGSNDQTLALAEGVGAKIISAPTGRGRQLSVGAEAARSDWLLFLHGDTALEPGWEVEVEAFLAHADPARPRAAAFRFALDDFGFGARMLERVVGLRCAMLGLPYGDQGLLISTRLYRKLGGYKPLPLMEDVDLVRRLGRGRLVMLRSRAVTSAVRYRKSGYLLRSLRNLSILLLYAMRVPPRLLARLYG